MGGVNGVYSTANKMKTENVQMRVCLCMQLLRKRYCDHVLSVVRLNHFRFLLQNCLMDFEETW